MTNDLYTVLQQIHEDTPAEDLFPAIIGELRERGLIDGLAVEDAAVQLGVERRRVTQLLVSGKLNGTAFGEGRRIQWLIGQPSVDRLVQDRAVNPPRIGRKPH